MKVTRRQLKKIVESFLQEAKFTQQEIEDATQEIFHTFGGVSVGEIAKKTEGINISPDTKVKFYSGGYHVTVGTVKLVELPGKSPYILLDV